MGRVKEFFRKPKHLYFSVILMFVVVVGLASVSFSYVEESSNVTTQSELMKIDTRISSEHFVNGKVELKAKEAKTITVNVMSNNSFESAYQLNYKASHDFVFVLANEVKRTIGAYDVHSVDLTVSNFNDYPVEVTIGLDTGYNIDSIVLTGNEVVEE